MLALTQKQTAAGVRGGISLEPGPTLVDMVTTGFGNPVVTISTRVGPGSRLGVGCVVDVVTRPIDIRTKMVAWRRCGSAASSPSNHLSADGPGSRLAC